MLVHWTVKVKTRQRNQCKRAAIIVTQGCSQFWLACHVGDKIYLHRYPQSETLMFNHSYGACFLEIGLIFRDRVVRLVPGQIIFSAVHKLFGLFPTKANHLVWIFHLMFWWRCFTEHYLANSDSWRNNDFLFFPNWMPLLSVWRFTHCSTESIDQTGYSRNYL